MCIIQIRILCSDRFFEVLPDDVESTEFTLEDLIGRILLDLFEMVIVERVTISFASNSQTGQQLFSIGIHAQCSDKSFPWLPEELEHMELAVEDIVSCALVELFGTVIVDKIAISVPPWEYDEATHLQSA